MIGMKKFIAFVIVMLPITAILSMGAGFWYAAVARRAGIAPVAAPTNASIAAPAMRVQPSVTPDALPMVDVRDYASGIRMAVIDCMTSQLRISALFGNPQIKSESWRLRIDTALRGIEACVEEIRAKQPPAQAQVIQANAMALADEYALFAKEMRVGLETNDLGAMTDGAKRLQKIGQLTDILDARIEAVMQP